jgi:hypothetical protein
MCSFHYFSLIIRTQSTEAANFARLGPKSSSIRRILSNFVKFRRNSINSGPKSGSKDRSTWDVSVFTESQRRWSVNWNCTSLGMKLGMHRTRVQTGNPGLFYEGCMRGSIYPRFLVPGMTEPGNERTLEVRTQYMPTRNCYKKLPRTFSC